MAPLFSGRSGEVGAGAGFWRTEEIARWCDLHPDRFGAPFPLTEVELRDAEGRPVPDGAPAELFCRSPRTHPGAGALRPAKVWAISTLSQHGARLASAPTGLAAGLAVAAPCRSRSSVQPRA